MNWRNDPFGGAPPWAKELKRKLEKIMATQADLDAKLDELQAAVTTELKQLADAIAKSAPDLAPQVAKVQAAVDALIADDPAVTPPTA